MPTVEVRCTVTNCVFHAQGNICGANKIEVNMDHQANKTSNTEFATEFDARQVKEEAIHSSQTCCKTFKPKAGK